MAWQGQLRGVGGLGRRVDGGPLAQATTAGMQCRPNLIANSVGRQRKVMVMCSRCGGRRSAVRRQRAKFDPAMAACAVLHRGGRSAPHRQQRGQRHRQNNTDLVCAKQLIWRDLPAGHATRHASIRPRPAGQRLGLDLSLGLGAGLEIASDTPAFICRLASAVAWPRKPPATRFAVLSHMLMKGFFFNQGLAISLLARSIKLPGPAAHPCAWPFGHPTQPCRVTRPWPSGTSRSALP